MPTNFETFQLVPITAQPTSAQDFRCSLIHDFSGLKYFLSGTPAPGYDALAGDSLPFTATFPWTTAQDVGIDYYFLPAPSVGWASAPTSGIYRGQLMAVSRLTGQGFAVPSASTSGNFPWIIGVPYASGFSPLQIFADSALTGVGFTKVDLQGSANAPCGPNSFPNGQFGVQMMGMRTDASHIYVCLGFVNLSSSSSTPASSVGVWKIPVGSNRFTVSQANALYWDVGPLPATAPGTWYAPGDTCGNGTSLGPWSGMLLGGDWCYADNVNGITRAGGGPMHGEIGFLVKSGYEWRIVTSTGVIVPVTAIQGWLDRLQISIAANRIAGNTSNLSLTLRYKNGRTLIGVGYVPQFYPTYWSPLVSPFFQTASWAELDCTAGTVAEYRYGKDIMVNPRFPAPINGADTPYGVVMSMVRENGVFAGIATDITNTGYYFEIHRTYAKGHSSTAYQFNLASLLKG